VAAAAGVEGVRWDFNRPPWTDTVVRERLERTATGAKDLGERWSAELLSTLTPEELAHELADLARLRATRLEATEWTQMQASVAGDDISVRDMQVWIESRVTVLDEAIRSFELAWLAVPDERAGSLPSASARSSGTASQASSNERIASSRDRKSVV